MNRTLCMLFLSFAVLLMFETPELRAEQVLSRKDKAMLQEMQKQGIEIPPEALRELNRVQQRENMLESMQRAGNSAARTGTSSEQEAAKGKDDKDVITIHGK